MSFCLLLNTKEDILKNVSNQVVDGNHWLPSIYIFSYYRRPMATVNCLATNIFQNVFVCAQHKKETHTGPERVIMAEFTFLAKLSL